MYLFIHQCKSSLRYPQHFFVQKRNLTHLLYNDIIEQIIITDFNKVLDDPQMVRPG